MYHHFVPIKLHAQADALIVDLKALSHPPIACPHCQHPQFYSINPLRGYYRCRSCKKGFNRSSGTVFYRLAPLEWLPMIASYRLCGRGYSAIRYELDYCTAQVVKKRVRAIELYMESHYPELYQWYMDFIAQPKTEHPQVVQEQHQQLKAWVTGILKEKQATCHYCGSNKAKKVGKSRASFRCQTCWRYFNNLKGTGLERLQHSENWLKMIDMLVDGKTNLAIQKELKISPNTMSRARWVWGGIMERLDLFVLKEWVSSIKHY